MELSIIILNWNAAADTIRCVRDFESWQQIEPIIWVVDNASEDGGVDKITEVCPQIHLIRNAVNQGYAGGNNRGLEKALVHSKAPIMLFNNDAVLVEAEAIKLLNTLRNNPQVGVIGPLLFDAQQPDKLLTAGGRNMVRHLSSHISTVTTDTPLQKVDYVPGTVLIARAEIFNNVGLLDEDYFFAGELPDLCYRVQQHGYLCAVDTSARAYHALERSSTFRATLYPYYIIRNRFIFIRKFYHLFKIFFFTFWTLYSAALAFKLRVSGQVRAALAVWLGLMDGLNRRFGGQNERILAACGLATGKPGSQTEDRQL